MAVFDERPTPSPARRRLLLLGLPVLAVLVWIAAAHAPHGVSPHGIQQTLGEFRGDIPADPSPNRGMAEALVLRRDLLMHPDKQFSLTQSRRLVSIAAGPVNDQAQSEALDVLSLAQRAHTLSPLQVRDAEGAALSALRGSPGPMVRLESARLLGHIGSPADAPALSALQKDSDPKVREAASEALVSGTVRPY